MIRGLSMVSIRALILALAFSAAAAAAQVSLTGTVTFSDGSPMEGVTVAIPTPTQQVEVKTDALGNYSLSIEEGTYQHLRIRNMSDDIDGIPRMLEYVAVEPLVIAGNSVEDVTMPPMPKISGKVRGPDGDSLPGARITAQMWDGFMTQLPLDENTAGAEGNYAVWLDTGTVKIRVDPPAGSNLSSFEVFVDHAKDTVMDLTAPANYVLQGTVTSAAGDTIRGVLVAMVMNAVQTETRTDSAGRYAFSVIPGTVQELRVRNMGDDIEHIPANIEYTAAANLVITAGLTRDIAMPVYSRVSGTVYTADSAVLAGVAVHTAWWDGNMNQLPTDDNTTDSLGRYLMYVKPGSTQFTLRPPAGPYSDETFIVGVPKDTVLDIYMTRSAIFTGRVLYHDSTPVRGIIVALSKTEGQWEAITDTSGAFTLLVEPDTYPDFRIRNMGSPVAGVPSMLEYTAAPQLVLADSLYMDVVLPRFPRLHGAIRNSALSPVENVYISGARWEGDMTQNPRDDHTTGPDGTYELFLSLGPNQVSLMPSGNTYGDLTMMLDLEGDLQKDIILADQAKGVARIQPSVISTGQQGLITITGVNTRFRSGVSDIDLGPGITVSNIQSVSQISLTADIAISDSAATGIRSIRVIGATESYAGTEIFTVTAPTSALLTLDNQNRLIEDLVIGDGTGTELAIAAGTEITLPPGAEEKLSFEAPIIKNNDVDPLGAAFLEVQREFFPDGVVFDPPAELTFKYQDQDVVGINELELKAFKYDNETDSIIGEYTILDQDTAKNIIRQEAPTFSLFRLAHGDGTVKTAEQRPLLTASIYETAPNPFRNNLRVVYAVPGGGESHYVTLRVLDMRGRVVRTLADGERMSGVYTLNWDGTSDRRDPLKAGTWFLQYLCGSREMARKLIKTGL